MRFTILAIAIFLGISTGSADATVLDGSQSVIQTQIRTGSAATTAHRVLNGEQHADSATLGPFRADVIADIPNNKIGARAQLSTANAVDRPASVANITYYEFVRVSPNSSRSVVQYDWAFDGNVLLAGQDGNASASAYLSLYDITGLSSPFGSIPNSFVYMNGPVMACNNIYFYVRIGNSSSGSSSCIYENVVQNLNSNSQVMPLSASNPSNFTLLPGRTYALELTVAVTISANRGSVNGYTDFSNTATFRITDFDGLQLTDTTGTLFASAVPEIGSTGMFFGGFVLLFTLSRRHAGNRSYARQF